MPALQTAVWILLAVLIAAGIVAVIKLISVLSDVSKTMDAAKQDMDRTMKRVDGVVDSLNTLLVQELTPTLQVTRQTIQHLEISARAAADATESARTVLATIESAVSTNRLLSSGGALLKVGLQKAGVSASHLVAAAASSLGHSVMAAMFGRRGNKQVGEMKALPPGDDKNGMKPSRKARVARR